VVAALAETVAAVVAMAAAIRAAVAVEKAKAAAAAAIDFRTKTTASQFASLANRVGSGSR
jgi:hypothetical protein